MPKIRFKKSSSQDSKNTRGGCQGCLDFFQIFFLFFFPDGFPNKNAFWELSKTTRDNFPLTIRVLSGNGVNEYDQGYDDGSPVAHLHAGADHLPVEQVQPLQQGLHGLAAAPH